MLRRVDAEILDDLAVNDPRAVASRRDLLRVHRVMQTRSILVGALRDWGRAAQAPLKMLELGCGDGRLMLRTAAVLAPDWPPVELTLLDRQPLLTDETIASYADLGWTAMPLTADVLDCARERQGAGQSPRFDIVIANLFLHHFTEAPLQRILGAVAGSTHRFLASEPRRSWLALAGSHVVGALGANAVTRQDAVVSVHAGFRALELSRLWPGDPSAWRLDEYPAGPFSHCFSAQRTGAT